MSWMVIPVAFVALSTLAAMHLRQPLGGPGLVLVLNCVFLGGLSALVMVLAARSFLERGEAGLLLLAAGAGLWGLTAVASGATGLWSPDATVTVHNGGALLSGACHAAAAGLLQGRAWPVPRRLPALAATAAGVLAAVAALTLLAAREALPPFFVQGLGGTPLRQAVLSAAVAAFAAGAAGIARGSSRSAFRHWYALGLGLVAAGLYGVLIQEIFGGPVGWVGRLAQYLGGVAMLLAAVSSVREAGAWTVPLGALLRRSEARYRSIFENMSEGLLLAERPADGAARSPVLTDLNPAGEAMTGLSRGRALGRPLRELFPAADPAAAAACGQVLRGGAPARFAAASAAGRHFEVVAFAPEPGHLALLISDDSARRRGEQALVEANARLRDADQHKNRFLAVLSHELRSPLAPLRNAAATLARAEPESDHARRAREILGRQVDYLTRLVDELLDLTRIASGKIRLEREVLDLNELVRRAGEDRRDSFQARGIAFRVDLPGERLRAGGDATRLAQVVGNLLQNAAKFTPAGGAVTLALARAGAGAELRVRDTGAGIEPALLGRLFEPFVQGEATLARSEGGLGLGLALVKGLVALHGGTIEARSEGDGKGSELIVRLPLLAEAAAAIPAGPAAPPAGP